MIFVDCYIMMMAMPITPPLYVPNDLERKLWKEKICIVMKDSIEPISTLIFRGSRLSRIVQLPARTDACVV